MTEYRYRWNNMSLDDLVEFCRETIYPEMHQDDLDPSEQPPTHEWLNENGYSGMVYTLRENHDLTKQEFFHDIVEDTEPPGESYDWGFCHEPTIEAITEFLEARADRRNLADSTIRSRKYKLAQFARRYEQHHGSADLLANLDDSELESEEFRRCMSVFDELDDELSTSGSKLKYCDVVRQFYDHLVDFYGAQYNPIDKVPKQYDWKRGDADNQTVDRVGMSEIYRSASSTEDRLLVLGLGAWGLRPNEVSSAHVSQFVLDSGDLDVDATVDNSTVSVYVHRDGTDVEDAQLTVNGDSVGSTDRFGSIRFSLDDRPTFEVQVTTDEHTQTTVFEVDGDRLIAREDSVNPHITFEQRKNGPGSVSLLYGQEILEDRIADLEGDTDWNGYLFPSDRSASGHITAETVNKRFKKLASNVGVTVDGDVPTAKMGRRFWYSIYSDASKAFVEELQGIAADQGSSSAEIVYSNYLSEEDRRKGRRGPMREELEDVFG